MDQRQRNQILPAARGGSVKSYRAVHDLYIANAALRNEELGLRGWVINAYGRFCHFVDFSAYYLAQLKGHFAVIPGCYQELSFRHPWMSAYNTGARLARARSEVPISSLCRGRANEGSQHVDLRLKAGCRHWTSFPRTAS